MFSAVKHSNFCEKLEIGEWPTESAFLVSALFLKLFFPSWIASGKLRCFGEAALSSRKQGFFWRVGRFEVFYQTLVTYLTF